MKLSHYEWDPEKDLIAEGGFAEVFKAKDINTANRWVALKIYKEAVSRGTTGSTGQKKYSLEQEFAKIDGLSHTNIISFYGLEYIEHQDAMSRTASYPVLIMEYAGEGTLKELSRNQLSDDNLEEVIISIIRATGYLHSQGIIHRDLKPGNVLFTKDRNDKYVAKITDFGISKDVLGDKTIDQSFTEGVGTPHYMAPEQFFKKKFGLNGEVSERTDIWAIGVILFQLLTGKRPFGQGLKDYELIRDEITQKKLDLSIVPEKFQTVISKCLEKEAVNRPETANELINLLNTQSYDEDLTIIPGQAGVVYPSATHVVKSKKKNVLITVIVGILILLGSFGGFKWYQYSKAKELLAQGWDYYKIGKYKNAYASYLQASDFNSGKAYYYLSLMNNLGMGIDKNYKKTLEYADKAIENNFNMAAFQHGWLYKYGYGVPVDSMKAVSYFKKSLPQIRELSNEGDSEAQNLLGLLYGSGDAIDKDLKKSFEMTKKSAENGHPAAIANLGSKYMYGLGVEKDCNKALEWFKKGQEINAARAWYGEGQLHYYGCDELKIDYDKAFESFKKAADLNNIDAQYKLGYMLQKGIGRKKDLDEAMWWYRKACEADNIDACNNLANIYDNKNNYIEAKKLYTKAAHKNNKYGAYNLGRLFESDKIKKDLDSANFWFSKAAHLKHSAAQNQLGYNFNKGVGYKINLDSAFYWYEKSALQNYRYGQLNLGIMYAKGHGCEQSYVKAKEWYEKAAAQNDGDAIYSLGNLYYNGNGVKRDYLLAREYFKKGADFGISKSQFMYALMHVNKEGGAQNYFKAREWYKKAALQDDDNSQVNLALLYYEGKGGSKDEKQAFYWYEKAAKNGNAIGQNSLAICYLYGIGVKKNRGLAKFWFEKSCKTGHKKSCEDIDKLL
ncbi:hypothetical protein FF125_07875 [Aureibaculum algae]|uniref:Protein kinase domain-containing protein n=1 Tax=Aureibaculum algae TaxID=2584122 RepID=A0A5B7TT07_9FLAO|nr:serine/threonine-protein kinase [Aureibaculum algae]QCX38353.1 hypothetical protein FF125_07875 [Aureibaculum algae]